MRTNDVPMAHELVRFYQIKGLKPPLNELKRLLHFFVQNVPRGESAHPEIPVQWTAAFELIMAHPRDLRDADDGALMTFVSGLLDRGLHSEAFGLIERCRVENSALVTDRVYSKLVQHHLRTGNVALAIALLDKQAASLPAADAQQSQLWLQQFSLVLQRWLSREGSASRSGQDATNTDAAHGTTNEPLERSIARQFDTVCANRLQCDQETIQVRSCFA